MEKMDLFIGSCVLESEELAMTVCERVLKDLEEFSLETVKMFREDALAANFKI